MISKTTIWSAVAVLLAGASVLVFYLFGGFELFSDEDGVQQNRKQYKSFSQFEASFNYVQLPYSIELSNMHISTRGLQLLDTGLVGRYVEKNRTEPDSYNKISDFGYYAISKFNIQSYYKGYIILKYPKNGKFLSKYFLRIFDNEGNLRSQMQIAEFIGDNKFLNIKEAIIGANYIITISDKGVIMSEKCDSIASIFTSEIKEYHISNDGNIDRRVANNR